MTDEDCPICGGKTEEGTCPRCGYRFEEQIFGDKRDASAEKQTEFKQQSYANRDKKIKHALGQLEEAALSSETPDWALELISSSLVLLNLPLETESGGAIHLSEPEKKLVSLSRRIMDKLDAKVGAPMHQPEIYVRVGNAFFAEGNFKDALENYKKALMSHPFDKIALYNEAMALFALARYDICLRELNKLIRRSPDHDKAMHLRELVTQMIESS
ncbi:MAG: hypothetical protein KAT70_08205 [Thermoplasmata archaeon]|nr:hypothetical protein [Thermoplasmata archaeon]